MNRPTQVPQQEEKAREAARAWFVENGIAVAAWARDHKFSRQVVVDVLRGKSKCLRGDAHKVAVALGIKPEPKQRSLKKVA
jgi:gp16 family phage-associated protein